MILYYRELICKNSDYQTASKIEQEVINEYAKITARKYIRISGSNYAAYNTCIMNNSIIFLFNQIIFFIHFFK